MTSSERRGLTLWTIREVSDFLRVHPKTISKWIRSRGFPCVRVGARIRFDPSDVTKWVSVRKEG